MDSNSDFTKNNNPNSNSFEEIDFKRIFNFFVRNKKFISSISLIFVFLGFLFSLFPKRTWEGRFQIVLSSDSSSTESKSFSLLSSIAESASSLGSENNLKTEVGILESPSVLMPAFKLALGINDDSTNNAYEFLAWKNNLTILLQKNTSILDISYKDKNKSIILPVLKKMSSTYQEYSGKRKLRIDENTEDYLKEQIQHYKEKSAKSMKLAQEFAIDQDLFYFERDSRNEMFKSNMQTLRFANTNDSSENVSIENIELAATNELRN